MYPRLEFDMELQFDISRNLNDSYRGDGTRTVSVAVYDCTAFTT